MTANTEGGAPPRGLATDRALAATRGWLIDAQDEEGYWVGELEGDSILESEYVLLMTYLGRLNNPDCRKMGRTIRDEQNAEGGWSIYPGGPSQVSATVKAYFVLKLLGTPIDDPTMVRARKVVLEGGGARACNSFTRFYLALLGQIPYGEVPYVPPELLLVPPRMPFSLASMSSWTRTIIVPLMILSVYKPCRPLPPEQGIAELFLDGPPPRSLHGFVSWGRFFVGADRAMKWADRVTPRSLRKTGIRAAHRWMLDHFENSDGLGGDLSADDLHGRRPGLPGVRPGFGRDEVGAPPARRPPDRGGFDDPGPALPLARLGHRDRDPRPDRHRRLARPSGLRAVGPLAPGQGGPRRRRLDRPRGDRRRADRLALPAPERALPRHRRHRDGHPRASGIAVPRRARGQGGDLPRGRLASGAPELRRGLGGLRPGHQQRGPDQGSLRRPQRDARPELRGYHDAGRRDARRPRPSPRSPGYRPGPRLYLEDPGARGVLVRPLGRQLHLRDLAGPARAQGDRLPDGPPGRREGRRLARIGPAGRRRLGRDLSELRRPVLEREGDVTPSQTAWAVLGLVAAGRASGEAACRGVRHLIDTQGPDGTWVDETYTGTGFPKVFYLRYHLYPISFSAMAIARHHAATTSAAVAGRVAPEPVAIEV